MRKIFIMFIFLVGFAFFFQVEASAEVTNYEKVTQIVETANEKIDLEVEKAIEQAALLAKDDSYEEDLDEIINKLLIKTEAIANDAIEDAAEYGALLICDYVEITIGDRIVLIDPLRVHDW